MTTQSNESVQLSIFDFIKDNLERDIELQKDSENKDE